MRLIRMQDQGSQPQCVQVEIHGMPAYGINYPGADITIMGGRLFCQVAAAARLQNKDLKKPDRTPRNYDRCPFTLNGHMDLDITFSGKTMCTGVYIKRDAHEQLLLSEGVCRQLDIVRYHPEVEPWRRCRRQSGTSQPAVKAEVAEGTATVPTIYVNLVQSLRLPPWQSKVAQVCAENYTDGEPLLLEQDSTVAQEIGLHIPRTLLQPDNEGMAQVVVSNPSGFTCKLLAGVSLGEATGVTVEDTPPDTMQHEAEEELNPSELPGVRVVSTGSDPRLRQQKLDIVRRPTLLDGQQTESLHRFLAVHHQAFCL